MLIPEQLAAISDYITPVYQDFEDTVLRDIARRIKKAGELTETGRWQALRLLQQGRTAHAA